VLGSTVFLCAFSSILGDSSYMSSIDILRCGLKNLDNQRAEAVRTVLTLSCYTLDKDDPFCNVHTARNPTWVLVATRWLIAE
jgi:hypothetical protein